VTDLAVDDTTLFWTERGPSEYDVPGPNRGAVGSDGRVIAMPLAGMPADKRILIDGLARPHQLRLFGDQVVVMGRGGTESVPAGPPLYQPTTKRLPTGMILQVPKAGGTAPLLVEGRAYLDAMAATPDRIYWLERPKGWTISTRPR
jgi:hypothetical protein